jgi:hypothetical protein
VKALLVAAQVYAWGAAISFAVALLIQVIFVVIRATSGTKPEALPEGRG